MHLSYLTPCQLAYVARCCVTTVAEWRRRGVGPAYETHAQKRGYRGTLYTYPVTELLRYTSGRWPETGRFLKTAQAAALLGISRDALRQRRRRGYGPAPVYFESLVRYVPEDFV